MSSFTSDLKPILAELRKSPSFAMSLGAKELFHSNFLAFLLESREPCLAGLQRQLRERFGIPVEDGEESWCLAFRELASLDLVLVPVRRAQSTEAPDEYDAPSYELSAGPAAVIEAKLKAIPTAEQLIGYNEKLADGVPFRWEGEDGSELAGEIGLPGNAEGHVPCKRWLLTLDGLPQESTDDGVAQWQPLAWTQIAGDIGGTSSQEASSLGTKFSVVLGDYAETLEQILKVLTRTAAMYRESRSRPYEEFLDQLTKFGALRAARLADLVGKRAFAEWLADIRRDPKLSSADGLVLASEAFFTKGQPGLTVEWQFEGPSGSDVVLRLGVQIQGKSFRRFVAAKPKWAKLDELAARPLLMGQWFSGALELTTESRAFMATKVGCKKAEEPRAAVVGTRKTNLRKFDQEAFLYSAADLSGNVVTLDDIKAALLLSMRQARELATKLQR